MGLLTLYTGLLLPWLGGMLWLAFADSRFAPTSHHNRFRQAGYGFFLGYALLFLVIMAMHSLTGTTSRTGLLVFLAVFAGSGGLAVWLSRGASISAPRPSQTTKSTALKLLTTLLLAWMGLHLAFVVIDIFTQPVYPWDAWLAWVYRAKAWYLTGGINAVVSPQDWATAGNVFSIDAWSYPQLPSVIPYWAALSLGQWSETLVNLPVLFAGIALIMALYGQCREHRLGTTTSLLCCYLLLSIPIMGTHLSLAGYADIWMAGFTGLGFIAVIRAALINAGAPQESDRGRYGMQMTVGILMLALAMLVKNEGAVWLLAALALLVLVTCRARVPIMIVVSIAVLTLLGFALGISYVDIPLIGTLGMIDGRLIIPFIGNFALELHNVWPVYWDNFFAMGSWNLLWVLVLASMFIAMQTPRSHIKRIGLTFISVFLITQLFIFGLTDQGLWADTFTAINRLPIHFVPALLFVAFVIMSERLADKQNLLVQGSASSAHPPVKRTQWKRPVLQALIVVAGLLVYLSGNLPDTKAEPLSYPATNLSFAFGSGHPDQDKMLVDTFANGYALLSSGPVNIQASNHPVLEYQWTAPRAEQEAAFFWRQKGQANNVLKTEITASGTHLIDLSTETDWQGEIIEFGFLIAGAQGDTVMIGPAKLQADSLNIRLQLMWQAWVAFEQRSQQSINFLQGGDHRQVVPLPLLIIAWLLTGVLLVRFWPNKEAAQQNILLVFCLLFLSGWMLLDYRWTANNFRQAGLSQWHADNEQRLSDDLDGEIYQYIQRLKTDVLDTEPARILIIGDENAIDYYLLRAKYHLLPHSVNVVGGFNQPLTIESIDYVIYFGQPDGVIKVNDRNSTWLKSLIEIDRGRWGSVFRIDS